MTEKLVSVVIPVYNGEKYLQAAVDSALHQSYPNLEIIVVNDGSTDASASIINAYRRRVISIEQPNLGVSAARNAGIKRASGDFIAFLDQDDQWFATKVEKQVSVFQRQPLVGLVHTDAVWFDAVRQQEVVKVQDSQARAALAGRVFEKLLLGNYVVNSSVMVRRAALLESGGFDESLSKNSCQDYDLWLRIAYAWEFAYLPEKLLLYRLHPGQGIWNRATMVTDYIKVLERAIQRFEVCPDSRLKAHLALWYARAGITQLASKEARSAQLAFIRSLRLHCTLATLVLFTITFLPVGIAVTTTKALLKVRSILTPTHRDHLPPWVSPY